MYDLEYYNIIALRMQLAICAAYMHDIHNVIAMYLSKTVSHWMPRIYQRFWERKDL